MKRLFVLLVSVLLFASCSGSHFATMITSMDIMDAQNLILATPSNATSRDGKGSCKKLFKETIEGIIEEVLFFSEFGKNLEPDLFPVHLEQLDETYIVTFYVQSEGEAELWDASSGHYYYCVLLTNSTNGNTWLVKDFSLPFDDGAFSFIPQNSVDGFSFFEKGRDSFYFIKKIDSFPNSVNIARLNIGATPTITDLNISWETGIPPFAYMVNNEGTIFYVEESSPQIYNVGTSTASGSFDYQSGQQIIPGFHLWYGTQAFIKTSEGRIFLFDGSTTNPFFELINSGTGATESIQHELVDVSTLNADPTAPNPGPPRYLGETDSGKLLFLDATKLSAFDTNTNLTVTTSLSNLELTTINESEKYGNNIFFKKIKSVPVINVEGAQVANIKAEDSAGNNLLVQLTDYYVLADNKVRLRGKNTSNQYVVYDVTYSGMTNQPAVLVETELFDPNTMELLRLK